MRTAALGSLRMIHPKRFYLGEACNVSSLKKWPRTTSEWHIKSQGTTVTCSLLKANSKSGSRVVVDSVVVGLFYGEVFDRGVWKVDQFEQDGGAHRPVSALGAKRGDRVEVFLFDFSDRLPQHQPSALLRH
jgi:hypothetical protein